MLPDFANELALLGWNTDETYLFAKGHTILPEVVRHFLKPLCEHLKTEKLTEIASKTVSTVQKERDKRHYEKSINDITALLNGNTEFKACHLFLKLKTDLDIYTHKYFN